MDEREFARRIEVYLEVDMPAVPNRRDIAESLAGRLLQYLTRPEEPSDMHSETVDQLFPTHALLVFTAPWDGNSIGYSDLVREAVAAVQRVVEINVDDPVGGAIARHYRVLNTPAVVKSDDPEAEPLLGRRSIDDLRDVLAC